MKVIASLTTLPSRIEFIEPVLMSMLNQSYPPDEIHIQIPRYCVKEDRTYVLPDFLSGHEKVKVFEHPVDYGPATKWLPALKSLWGQGVLLLVMDDDCQYSKDMVRQLIEGYTNDPKQVYCSTGGILQGNPIGQFLVAEKPAENALTIQKDNKKPVFVDTVQGFSLVLFEVDLIEKSLIEWMNRDDLTDLADDILLSSMFEKQGIRRVQIAPYQVPKPLDHAEINPIHGEGRLTEMSMRTFLWVQKQLLVWREYVFVTAPDGGTEFKMRGKSPRSVIKRFYHRTFKYRGYTRLVLGHYLKRLLHRSVENKYLFILGATHAGTTLLNEILSSSKNASSNNNEHTREGQLLPTVTDHMFAHKRQWEEDLHFDWHFIRHEWRKYWDVTRKVLIEKSPPNLLRAREIESVFEPAYFLIFVRNPYAHCETFLRKNNFSPFEAATFVVKTLDFQKRNLKELKRTVLIRYETLVDDPESFKKDLTAFLPELEDVETTGEFKAHNYYQRPQKLRNFNAEKIARLTSSDFEGINQVFEEHQSLLEFFGYTIQRYQKEVQS